MVYVLIFILTVFDALCTYIGVRMDWIEEGNLIMAMLFDKSIVSTCTIVIVATGFLLLWIRKKAMQYRWIEFAMIFVLIVKFGIAGMHIFWLSLL